MDDLPSCDPSFNASSEVRKYILQVSPLIISLFLHVRFICEIRRMYRKHFRLNSFYSLYLVECILNSFSILALILLEKPTTYLTPLCPWFLKTFPKPTYLLNVFWLCDYFQLAKFLSHAFISLNRMTCVVFPLQFAFWWNRWLFSSVLFTFLAPFIVLWTVFAAKTKMVSHLGGIKFNYEHVFPWARLSLFKAASFVLILVIVVFCSAVMIFYLLKDCKRVKGSDRNLCLTTAVSTLEVVGFLLVQLFFVLSPFRDTIDVEYDNWIQLQSFVYDMVLFLDPIVMLQMNGTMRSLVFGNSKQIRSERDFIFFIEVFKRKLSDADQFF